MIAKSKIIIDRRLRPCLPLDEVFRGGFFVVFLAFWAPVFRTAIGQ